MDRAAGGHSVLRLWTGDLSALSSAAAGANLSGDNEKNDRKMEYMSELEADKG